MQLKARLATNEDLDKLTNLIHDEYGDPIDFVRKRVSYYIDNHFMPIIEDIENKRIAGRLFFQAKENPLLGVGEFEGVVVSEDYRSKGVGKILIESAIKYAEEYFKKYNTKMRCLYVMTRSSNDPAIALYGKFGFKKQNTIGKIFKDDEPDELVMVKFF